MLNSSNFAAGLEDFSETLRSGDPLFTKREKQYQLLDLATEQLAGQGIISTLPESKPESADAYSRSRLKTIRNRLYLLGYLERDSGQASLGPLLDQGMRSFQQDAGFSINGFIVDGWTGEQSWQALQELVSFESPTNLDRWFQHGKASPALIRATHLRLFALGLVNLKPGKDPDPSDLRLGLAHFCEIMALLEISDLPLTAEPSMQTLTLLFDQDRLLQGLGRARAPKAYEHRQQIKPFIINMAKIELWMLGYEIIPDGYSTKEVRHTKGRELDLKANSRLYKCICRYWQERGERSARLIALKLVKGTFPRFFASLCDGLVAGGYDQPVSSETIFRQLSNYAEGGDQALIRKVWDQVYAFGSRIWDGVSRTWRWITMMLKRGGKSAAAFFGNLSRLAYRYILKAYEATKSVVKAVISSADYLTRPVMDIPKVEMQISVENQTVIGRDRDFDFRVIVGEQDRAIDVYQISDWMNNISRLFSISCHLLAELLDILIGVMRGGLFVGWAALLMGLLKFYKSIDRWLPELIAVQQRLPD